MKLGSIVGIVLSCLLIISGIVLCTRGKAIAEENNQSLFVEVNEDGTYYSQKITNDIKRIKIEYENADIVIKGGASESKIEFRNFNPSYYAMSVTSSIITFEETPSIESFSDIWENGLNFKGLRYALEFWNDDFDGLKRSITVSLGSDIGVKNLDVVAAEGSIKLDNVSLDGDISLSIRNGKITVNDLSTTSSLDISGDKVNTTANNVTAPIFRYMVSSSKLDIDGCSFNESVVNVSDGDVKYSTVDTLTEQFLAVAAESGTLTVNTTVRNEALNNSPEEFTKKLTIKTVNASIDLTYPEVISDPTVTPDGESTITE